ncbi:MAG: OmpA family protein [Candidatus Krumholzibacteriia bacterium]
MNSVNRIKMLTGVVLLLLLAQAGAAWAQDTNVGREIRNLEARFQAAREASWNLIAPRTFDQAQQKLDEARQKFAKGDKIEDIRKRVTEAGRLLQDCAQYEGVGKLTLDKAMTARTDALSAKATEFADAEWKDASTLMYDAGRAIEKGDQNEARKKAAAAEARFRDAELQAIRVDLLGTAGKARDAALAVKAQERMPQVFAIASRHLADAEATLEGDRYQRGAARGQAELATREFRHATQLVQLADRMDVGSYPDAEKVFLELESGITNLGADLKVDVDYSEGLTVALDNLRASLASLVSDRENLAQDYQATTHALQMATQRADSLAGELSSATAREKSAASQVAADQKRQQNLKKVQEMFTPDEASVVIAGDDIIIRLVGLQFAIGKSVIQPDGFALLTKLQRAIRVYPDAGLVVEGHTDASGDAAYNEKLSLERAQAVLAYLQANMAVMPTDASAAGYGESLPIASNETPEGRTMNRRIDVRLKGAFGG